MSRDGPVRHIGAIRRVPVRTIDETAYLLASPKNARRLREAMDEAKAGGGIRVPAGLKVRGMFFGQGDQ
jgi:hypothetical protein